MFDFLDANKSGELYTAEAVDGLRKLDDNRKIPFNLTWREVNISSNIKKFSSTAFSRYFFLF